MSRAVANTLLPAARPASTIARPRPRELPVTNHTCAIHPPLSSHPRGYSGEAFQPQDWMRDGIRTDLLVTGEIAESSDLRATPFEFERAKRVEAALSILEGKWKIVILNRLFARPIWRFSELERAVPGISQRMLSQQLRLLEKCELVKRTVHPQFPPKVEYELTEFGKTLCPAMKTLVDWAMTFPKTRETSRYQPRKARKAF